MSYLEKELFYAIDYFKCGEDICILTSNQERLKISIPESGYNLTYNVIGNTLVYVYEGYYIVIC